ncbi:MAG: 2-succinyl-5-enolpyruvyl-6-hydroxy-3-cyclohexene-1-carboxylic-acid synthase [Pseudonocardiales bacterium]
MNPGAALSFVVVDELVRAGMTEAVLSPGSRSAPLALALVAHPQVRLHVRIDERSAGFLAVGLAQISARPVALICTSGTATANLHPAVLEAAHSRVPIVVLTADRPPELRGTGANQTTDQMGMYGGAACLFAEVGAPEERPGMVGYWRSLVSRAVGCGGPAHLNVALREPLVGAEDDGEWVEPLSGRAEGRPWTVVHRAAPASPVLPGPPERGVVVVGHGAAAAATEAALRLARDCGWPVLSEPTGNARVGPNAVATYPLLLANRSFAAAQRPDLVLSVGKPGLSRSLLSYLPTARRHVVVDPGRDWADPTRSAAEVWPVVPVADRRREPTSWLAGWLGADALARRAADQRLDADLVSEPRLARDLVAALPDGALLVAGSSQPIRDLEAYPVARAGLRIVGNRGVSGIDGLVSTAVGAALAHGGPAYALLGDLTVLHDQNGLILGPGEPRPDLAIVVVNNDGGGIFSTLEQAGRPGFEQVFGTPHGVDFERVAAATATPYQLVGDLAKVPAALDGEGLRMIEVRTERTTTAALHRDLQAGVDAALSE